MTDPIAGRTLVFGTCAFRSRAELIEEEGYAVLQAIGMANAFVEFAPGGPTTQQCRMRLRSWDDVTAAISRLRGVTLRPEH